MLLENKVALITGAASGIGRATAQLFAKEGANVVVVDIDENGSRETVKNITNRGGNALFINSDIGKMSRVEDMISETINRYGQIDIIHSNAAVNPIGNAIQINERIWDNTLSICLKATWMIAHHAIPSMLNNGGGNIIITGSVHSIRGYQSSTPYQASKGGVLSLTRSLAADFGPTIRVNAILPGAIVTPLWDKLKIPRSDHEKIAKTCTLKRNGTPDDIANAALFLASDMSSFMTGAHIVVDGGLTSIMELPYD